MKFLFSLLILFTSSYAFAVDQSSGCGPGWYILKDNSLISSALRATTNEISFPISTLGMTFGTSNCTQHKLVLKEKESLYFATMNHYELKRDLAKGGGEYVSAFASTMGCPASAQARLNQNLRTRFSKIYPEAQSANQTANPENVLLEVYKTIFQDKELTQKCSLGVA